MKNKNTELYTNVALNLFFAHVWFRNSVDFVEKFYVLINNIDIVYNGLLMTNGIAPILLSTTKASINIYNRGFNQKKNK